MREFVHTGDTADMIERDNGTYAMVSEARAEIEKTREIAFDDVRAAARYVDLFEGSQLTVRESVEVAIVYATESEKAARHLAHCLEVARRKART